MQLLQMQDQNLAGKRVLIREDLNVPIANGKVSSGARLKATLPTIELALNAGAKVMVMSHLGRPTEGEYAEEYSLAPVADYLGEYFGRPVPLIKDWLEQDIQLETSELVLLENVRFHKGEKANDEQLAAQMAKHCDIYVMDAFGTAHRAQASTEGIAQFAPIACAGPLLVKELNALEQALTNPKAPIAAIVGGSKVSTKLSLLETLADKVDQLIVGGGIANTFLAAAGYSVGKSLYEEGLIPQAKALMERVQVPLPTDVVVATEFTAEAEATIKNIADVTAEDMILDIGPEATQALADLLKPAGTIIWNGPVGVFEFDQFGNGTKGIAQAIVTNQGFSIAGGGDTLAAVEKYDISEQLSYISTGGGAFLEFVEGKVLPAVAILEQRAKA